MFGLLGGKSKQKYFMGINQKNNFTGEKTKNDLYYRGKDLLTLTKKQKLPRLHFCGQKVKLMIHLHPIGTYNEFCRQGYRHVRNLVQFQD